MYSIFKSDFNHKITSSLFIGVFDKMPKEVSYFMSKVSASNRLFPARQDQKMYLNIAAKYTCPNSNRLNRIKLILTLAEFHPAQPVQNELLLCSCF
jgi:hypothetical protein